MKFTRTKMALLATIGLMASVTTYVATRSNEEEKTNLTAYQEWALDKIEKKQNGKVKSEAPEIHGIIQRELRTKLGDDGPKYRPNQVMEEFLKAKKLSKSTKALRTTNDELDFIERGPGNVGGRTRALVVDPDDPNQETFYAGAASGGIWKTTNAGADWIYISSDIPNMGVNTLVMAPSNTDIMYAGTGEHFTNDIDGAGMFKSTDRGVTWVQIANPTDMPDFKNVSRIAVDPLNEDVVIATTRSSVWGSFSAAIYKTVDGGQNWTRLRSSFSQRFDDIAYDPSNFNTLYVAIRAVGVIKSVDGGTTWTDASVGLVPSGRVEIAISPVNTSKLWASVEGGLSGSNSDLYVTTDGAQTWSLVVDETGTNRDFLGGQGWYDNIITAHPFDENIVYVGGVNTWKFELTGSGSTEITTITPVQDGTDEFMSFVDFGGGYLGGGMDLGTVAENDLLEVEIRFGQGTQKAHRFTVGGLGAGVPATSYQYQDYVEVPFQVWDPVNNVQLMASFRDQQEDGSWNLMTANTSGATSEHSREYLYIHSTKYSESPNASIATTGGHETNQMYFFWPVYAGSGTFDPASLPQSSLNVEFRTTLGLETSTTSVSDAYSQFGGPNSFPQATRTAGLHPDQHNIVMYDLDEGAKTFRILTGNDGGVYRTLSSTDPGPFDGDYEFISYGYNTTQFYSADKAPGENRYAGGMQDNGTWFHSAGTEGSAEEFATFGIGGDGFETLWHSKDVNKLIGGSQYNNFARSSNGGVGWVSATSGFDDEGPFITRLSHHKSVPDKIYTVGATGVWYSENFGTSWIASSMNNSELWSFSNSADVEVSYANPDVIWAGGALHSNGRLFVSTDGGKNFDACQNTALNLGSVSGIGTHPWDDSVVYALFSFAGSPKVIKSVDLGQNWEDISGFDGTGSASERGFPDVAVNCLFVFPNNPDRIWVGSEIGIIESLDGGASWSLLDSNMPPVNIYDFKLVDDQIVIATYGRGIWSVTIDGIVSSPVVLAGYTDIIGRWQLSTNLTANFDSVEVYLDDVLVATEMDATYGENTFTISPSGDDGLKTTKVVAYLGGTAYPAEETDIFLFNLNDVAESYETHFADGDADFASYGFMVGTSIDLSDEALHSDHPYGDGVELYSYLRSPIEVDANKGNLNYVDIALIEPGEAGSTFGQEAFNDYVVLEASTDGKEWIALGDGYDASLHTEWTDAYTNGNVSSSLFKAHSIKLSDYFGNGQQILLRFRLYSNSSTSGYGWVVDDLSIQTGAVLSTAKFANTMTIYPNPVGQSTTLRFVSQAPSKVEVFNLNGQKVDEIETDGKLSIEWERKQLLKGTYILRYTQDGNVYSKKVLLK